jgi:molybdopterin-guanine dinucleotide biosynthesis protein A
MTVAILAGGKSRRMGFDKALLLWQGVTLLERVVRAAWEGVGKAMVIGRTRPPDWPAELASVPFVQDRLPGLGPLGGLVTALEQAQGPVLLVGCDMPLLVPEALRWLTGEFDPSAAGDGVVTTREGRLEPLFSVYSFGVLGRARLRLQGEDRSLHGLIEEGMFLRREIPSRWAPLLAGVNTPLDTDKLTHLTSY